MEVNIKDAGEWSSIDIYLFSNGQQYSPPRKYHLRSEELQWWGSTVSYLGRTHYGSGHSSIDLYTIEGRKINGPMEIINGAAYVAVEPPDAFVNAGYEEYLVKASRSFEKRLAQKVSPEIPSPENTNNIPRGGTDDTGTPIDVVKKVPLKFGNDTILPSHQIKPLQQLQRKCIGKTIHKKKSLDTQSSAIKRICVEKDKIVPCPEKKSPRVNDFTNQKHSTNFIRNMNKNKLSFCKKRDVISKPDNIEVIKTKSNQSRAEVYPLLPCTDNTNLKIDAQENNKICDTVPNKEQPFVSLHETKDTNSTSLKNEPEYDPISSKSVDQENDVSQNHNNNMYVLKERIEDTKDHVNQDYRESNEYKQRFNLPLHDNFRKYEKENNSEEIPVLDSTVKNSKFINEDTFSISSMHISEKQVTDEYIAYLTTGGVLILKLKIKLKDCKTIYNKDKIKNSRITTSLINLSNIEKSSQVDISINISGQVLKANDHQNNHEQSLESFLNKFYSGNTDNTHNKNPNIIILQCACRDDSDNHKKSMDGTFCGCDHEEIKCKSMPERELDETLTCCQCYEKALRASKDENTIGENVLNAANGTRVKELAQNFESCDKIENISNENNTTVQNKNPLLNNEFHQMTNSPIIEINTKQSFKEEHRDKATFKNICDKSTQTDLCTVLLEARCQEGDYYTFHLPSLQFLKHYNL